MTDEGTLHDRQSISAFEEEYATFFAPRTHRFETIDFRTAASPVNLEKYFPKSARERTRFAQAAALLGVAVGIVIGVVGFVVDQLLRGVVLAIYTPTEVLLRRATPTSFAAAVAIFSALCCLSVFVAALLVVFIAPLGAGSGIPELKAYLNGIHIPGFLRFRTLVVKAVGVAFSIGGGLICGKQGPMIHAGAVVGAGMSQGASAQFKFRLAKPFEKTFRFLRTEAWKRDFTAVGAAVGVAVAFGAPMGGWVWVYEEACTHWTWTLGLITLGGCLSGVITASTLNYLANGLPRGGFQTYTLSQYGKLFLVKSGFYLFPLKALPMYALLGAFGGVIGAVLPAVNKYITLFRYKHVKHRPSRLFEAFGIALLTAVLRIVIPYIANDCRPINQNFLNAVSTEISGDYSRFNCPEGHYSVWAAVIYNPTSAVVKAMLYTEGSFTFPAALVMVAFFYYYFFIVWTYGVAVPAGVFFPGFLAGTVYGRLFGITMQSIFPSRTDVSVQGYAFLGAVSALAGLTRTISVAIIALEAVGVGEAFFGAVFVALIAKLVADKLFTLGIYDLHISLKGMPFLTDVVPHLELYNRVRVRDIMETNVVGVRRHSRVGEILHVLRTTSHHSFPVFLKLRGLQRRGYVLHKYANDSNDTLDQSQDLGSSSNPAASSSEAPGKSDKTTFEHSSSTCRVKASSIITPTPGGMQATRFEHGSIRVVKLSSYGEVRLVAAVAAECAKDDDDDSSLSGNSSSPASTSRNQTDSVSEAEVPDFGLIGMVSRDVLLAVLESILEMRLDSTESSGESNAVVNREKLDAAWPNSLRRKAESTLLDRLDRESLRDFVIDIISYIDPDPLLLSGRALSCAAYQLLRSTGARHILATNMKSGRVVGIVTRKDILPESIQELTTRLTEIKVE